MKRYLWADVNVSPQFRDLVFKTYPALSEDSGDSLIYRRMMEYFLFGVCHYDRDSDLYELIFPYTLMNSFRKPSNRKGDSTLKWLHKFRQCIAPLYISPYCPEKGKSRVVRAEISPDILAAAEREILRYPDEKKGRVEFVSGASVSARAWQRMLMEYEQRLRSLAWVAAGHPARDLVEFLNQQSQATFRSVIKGNLDAVRNAVLDMPARTAKDRLRRHAAFRVLRVLLNSQMMLYRQSDRTTRIHAVGTTIHQLPRQLRKLALRGCISLDLKAAQLAIVSTLWEAHRLYDFLSSGKDIWEELYAFLNIGPEYKPCLKSAIYSITFGMKISNVKSRLTRGVDGDPGLGREKSGRFFEHPLIDDLVHARKTRF